VNLPQFLSDLDELALKDTIKPNTSTVLPTPLTEAARHGLNCMQAYKLCVQQLSDSHTTDQEKAIYYCWLFHIVGDVHQPLHCTSLISRTRFNQSDGDRGGHLPVKQASSLHSYWDGLFGEEQALKQITDKTRGLLTEQVRKAAEEAKNVVNADIWVQESHKVAKEHVYAPDILAAVAAGEDSHRPLKRIDLSDAYQKRAKEIADQRVAEAGYRLAEILRQLEGTEE
jgi:hypothetical protein